LEVNEFGMVWRNRSTFSPRTWLALGVAGLLLSLACLAIGAGTLHSDVIFPWTMRRSAETWVPPACEITKATFERPPGVSLKIRPMPSFFPIAKPR
jgi:hypothetical protein